MADGKEWTTANLDADASPSYCYDDAESNCRRRSGFNAVLGGNRSEGQYARLEAHGLYWTALANDPATAPYYNFGQNGGALHRQPQGEKQMAISVRCIRD
jgi:uncharacterized protein (TIGR02145 family)